MGMVVDGRWVDEDRHIMYGRYLRPKSVYSDDLDADLAGRFRSQPGRYRLIASLSCPWSHRAMLVRALKGLEDCVPLQIAGGLRAEGYAVNGGASWAVPGTGTRIRHLHELYTLSDPDYTGRATVPVLWDSHARQIVSNESARIVRAFDAADAQDDDAFTLAPPGLRDRIDVLNDRLHDGLSNAVYRAGFAQRQDAYDEAVGDVFATLDEIEERLGRGRYLFGALITETDWRLLPTLVRFDAVYYVLFKCARKRIIEFPNLWAYTRDLLTWRGVAGTVDLSAIREGSYSHDRAANPSSIVAVQPDADWSAPHGRERFGPARVGLVAGGEAEVDATTFTLLRQEGSSPEEAALWKP